MLYRYGYTDEGFLKPGGYRSPCRTFVENDEIATFDKVRINRNRQLDYRIGLFPYLPIQQCRIVVLPAWFNNDHSQLQPRNRFLQLQQRMAKPKVIGSTYCNQ